MRWGIDYGFVFHYFEGVGLQVVRRRRLEDGGAEVVQDVDVVRYFLGFGDGEVWDVKVRIGLVYENVDEKESDRVWKVTYSRNPMGRRRYRAQGTGLYQAEVESHFLTWFQL